MGILQGSLYCIPPYNVCRHLIRADIDLTSDIDDVICSSGAICGYPVYQNMLRIYDSCILHHRAYHPSFDGVLMKRGLDCVESDEVEGTDSKRYACIKSHDAAVVGGRPISGGGWTTYWVRSAHSGGDVWNGTKSYKASRILQEYLQNILGIRNDKIFTLMHVNSLDHPAYLYCIGSSDMDEISKLDVSYYAGQKYGGYDDWDWTSVSAMNQQTGVIAIFRYNNVKSRNYVGCFDASPSLGFLCDVSLHVIRHIHSSEALNEPQVWPFEGFVSPEIPEEDPPVEVIVPPGESPGPGEVPYEPPPLPPDPEDDNIPVLSNGFRDYISVGPGETVFFKLVAGVSDCEYPIYVASTPQSRQPFTVHVLVKRGSKPTISDFERTWIMSPSMYDCDLGQWIPAKPGAEDLYWHYNIGPQTELLHIKEPIESNTFYIMLYNSGRSEVRNQCLSVHYHN